MAITASQITPSQTLEEFRLEYNRLQSDVTILKDNPTFASNLVFEGATADAYETTLNVIDPTADRVVNLPDASGTLLLTGQSTLSVANGGTIGSVGDADAITIATDGQLTFTQALTATSADFSGVVTATTFEPDGDTAAGDNAAIGYTAAEGLVITGQGSTNDVTIKNDADADVIEIPTGTTNVAIAGNLTIGGTLAVTGAAQTDIVQDETPQLGGDLDVLARDIVSSSNRNIDLSPHGSGVVRIDGNVDIQTGEIVLKNGGSVSNIKFYCESSNAHYTQLQSAAHSAYSGNVTLTLPAATDTIVGRATTDTLTNKTLTTAILTTPIINAGAQLKNGATCAGYLEFFEDSDNGTNAVTLKGPAATADLEILLPAIAGTVALTGTNILVPDDGTIGSASDTNAIAISSAGVVTVSSSTASSSKTTGALVVTGGIGTSADLYVGDFLQVEGDLWLKGDNKELRFYEGANYVGFEAPALSANQIWVLPAVDASDSGDVLMSNASGTLSWSTAVSGVATNFTVTANNTANETVFPLFVDGATGSQGAETDTGFTYNPSTGLLSTAALTLTGALTVGGTTTLNGNLVLGDAAADSLTIGATIAGASPLVFEGASANAHETTFAITDPTADRTITFPDATGTVQLAASNITIPDAGTIGSASDTNAIAISSGGVVALSATTASTSATSGALTVAGGAGIAADLNVGDDLFMISDGAVITFGANSEIALTHVHDVGLQMTSTVYAPLSRRGEDVFIVMDQSAAAGTDAGDNIIMDRSAADTDVGDDIIGEDEVFLHSGMQRNVINIRGSNGKILNSVSGFAPGAI